jgi:phytoene dehydrogenase-like protein
MDTPDADVIVIGSGMGGLTAAALLVNKGLRVKVIEQNYIAGGCTTSYQRKGYWFESGATTLVGLNEHMPLHYVCNKLGIQLNTLPLDVPMVIHLANGTQVTRYQNLEQWITEAERVFGAENQRGFWQQCYRISNFVWENSLQQLSFPPANLSDLLDIAANVSLKQLRYVPYSFVTMKQLLQQHNLWNNNRFVDFVNEQLIISAQNYAAEVNVLFGAAALCYTNYTNHYIPGGNAQLVKPFVDFICEHKGELVLRERVIGVSRQKDFYLVDTNKSTYTCRKIIAAIPLNNVVDIFDEELTQSHSKKVLPPEQLYSAYQLNIAAKRVRTYKAIHQQIHLYAPLPGIDAATVFLSLSHPHDELRCKENELIASVTTHIRHPHQFKADKAAIDEAVLNLLHQKELIRKEEIIYRHSSVASDWEKWTCRKYGFVGGYPQYNNIKPWQMPEARLDKQGAYLCGDSAYPGQGIPGVTLSGIIAAHKLLKDDRRLKVTK